MLTIEMDAPTWPALQGLVTLRVPLGVWPVVLWQLAPGQKVSSQIIQAGEVYYTTTGKEPDMAMLNSIPAGAAEFLEIKTMTLVLADWVKPGYVAISQTGTTIIDQEYRRWHKIAN
jgi:hypothetical protein